MYIFEGNLLKLKKEDGHEIVEHPGACAVVIHLKEKDIEKICLVKQFRKAVKKNLWEIPAGKIDKEDPDIFQTIKREAFEETGIDIDEQKLKYLGYIYTTPAFSNEAIHIFYYPLDSLTNVSLKQMDLQEINEIKFFSLNEIKQMISKNEITDTKTISAFTFCILNDLIKFE
ncbi:MAG: NUDIX hydrolase [bacterium]|jgi:ADP-ribose pyrophosphatase